MHKETRACFIIVDIDGTGVNILDVEGYGNVSRLFRTREEAVACYEWTTEQLLAFHTTLTEKGWELDKPYTHEWSDEWSEKYG